MRLADFNTLEVQTTIYDDTVFKQPYSLPPRRYIRGIERRNEPQEWACTDNRDYFDPTHRHLGIQREGQGAESLANQAFRCRAVAAT